MKSATTNSDSVRIPTPVRGVATHVRRYNEARAVILHPADYERLTALDHLHVTIASPAGFEVSDAARVAHLESLTPSRPVEDRAEIKRLLS